MSNTTNQTWEDLRVSIGRLLRVVKLVEADAAGSTTTFLTDELATSQDDDFNGKWLIHTGGQANIDGEITQVVDSATSSNRATLTYFPATSNAPVDGATAELWDEDFDPLHILGLAKQAVIDATGYVFNRVPLTDGAARSDRSVRGRFGKRST